VFGETIAAIDVPESAAVVAPVGITRIRRAGGVLQSSTDGAGYVGLGGGGSGTVMTSSPVSGDGSSGTPVALNIGAGLAVSGGNLVTSPSNINDQTFIGNTSGAPAAPAALTATQATAMLNAATASLKGLLSSAMFTRASNIYYFSIGAALADADATVNPGTDHASMYVMTNGVPTATRNITLSNTSCISTQLVKVVNCDTAHTLVIKNAAGTAIVTLPVAPSSSICVSGQEFFSASWAANTIFYDVP